jgi:hypothetical protein
MPQSRFAHTLAHTAALALAAGFAAAAATSAMAQSAPEAGPAGGASVRWHVEEKRLLPLDAPLRAQALALGVPLAAGVLPGHLHAQVQLGQRLDADAGRVGRGASWALSSRLGAQAPNGWAFESRLAAAQGRIDAPDGQRSLGESALRWAGVAQFNARSSLQLQWQRERLARAAEPGAGLSAQRAGVGEATLAFEHRGADGLAASVGVARQTGDVQAQRVFAKLSLPLGR